MMTCGTENSNIKNDTNIGKTPQIVLNLCKYMIENNIEEMPLLMEFGEVEQYKTMRNIVPYDFEGVMK